MTKLSSISISNVRRFSEDVTLNISSGATIILAPNGTGKTSIFEAIELALTGGVRRLSPPPDALIRDNRTNAKIRLNFDDANFCEAIFNKGITPNINIQHPNLFGNVDKDNIPYLLRLTHLLNQSSRDWFVQSTGTIAGQQLDSLSIGKDAQHVNGNMTSLKRATTALLENIKRESDDAKEKLDSWKALLGRRSTLTAISETGLTPKKDLIGRIQQVDTSMGPINVTDQIPSINAYLNEINLQNSRSISEAQEKLTRLESLKSIVLSYIQVIAAIRTEITEESKKLIETKERQRILDELNKEIDAESRVLEDLTKLISENRTNLSNRVRFDEASMTLVGLKQHLIKLNKDLDNALQLLQSAQIVFDADSEKSREAKGIVARQLVITKQKSEYSLLQPFIVDWQNAETNLAELRVGLIEFKKQLTEKQDEVNQSQTNLRIATDKKLDLEKRIKSLSETSDTIKQAVATIASNIPKGESNCPVCLATYAPVELQDRIERALNAIDINIAPLNEELKNSKDEVIRLAGVTKTVNEALDFINKTIKKTESDIETLLNNISIFKEKFLNANNSIEASLEFDNHIKDLNKTEELISKELIKLSNVPTDEYIASSQSDLHIRASAKAQLESNISSVKKQIENQEKVEKDLLSTIDFKVSKEVLDGKIFQLETDYRRHDEKKTDSISKLKQQNDSYESLKKQHINIQTNIQKFDFRKQELLNIWRQEQLINEPNGSDLEKQHKEVEQFLAQCQINQLSLSAVEAELAKWQAYEQYYQFENDVKDRTGTLSEEEYAKQLEKENQIAIDKLSMATKNNQVLNAFSRNLDVEIGKINTRLEAINPTLGRILNRLTVDPRFAETHVESYSYYKKSHADMKVPLHKSTVRVSDVASEAQITDVQFSFLLAMAQTYQWSPWKALLLDDPTQHHDLVHASSVFDILRDYIADYGFQVVLATHDSVQAKFFLRKLENDGIPCSLVSLKSTEQGVVVE
jgi:DNA repair protein SbcC/Rad50